MPVIAWDAKGDIRPLGTEDVSDHSLSFFHSVKVKEIFCQTGERNYMFKQHEVEMVIFE